MLFVLSMVASGVHDSTLVLVLNAMGVLFGQVLEYPGSPLAAVIHHLPEQSSLDKCADIRSDRRR